MAFIRILLHSQAEKTFAPTHGALVASSEADTDPLVLTSSEELK